MGTGTKKKEIGNFNYQRRVHSFFLRRLTNRDKQGAGGPRLNSGNFASTKVMSSGKQSPPSWLLCDADGCRIIPDQYWLSSHISQGQSRPHIKSGPNLFYGMPTCISFNIKHARPAPVNWSGHNVLTGKSLKKLLKFDRSRECGVTMTAINQPGTQNSDSQRVVNVCCWHNSSRFNFCSVMKTESGLNINPFLWSRNVTSLQSILTLLTRCFVNYNYSN